MNDEQLINAIVRVVHESAISGVKEDLLDGPSGRSPAAKLLKLHNWYSSLREHDRDMVDQCIGQGVHAAVFGVLCVLDGVRVLEDGGGEFTLRYQNSEGVFPLNGDSDLHDIYQGSVFEEIFGDA